MSETNTHKLTKLRADSEAESRSDATAQLTDTRQAYYPHELPDDLKAVFDEEYRGEATPELDHLLD